MSILIGFICAILGCFLLLVPSVRKQPNRFLAAFLFLTAIELSVWLWGPSFTGANWASGIWDALGKLQMPAFFFFFIASCYSDFRLKWYDALHLIPFALALFFAFVGPRVPALMGNVVSDAFMSGTAAATAVSHIVYYGYLAAIIVILWRFRQRFRLHHSGGRSEVLVWLTQFAAVSLFAHTIVLVRDVMAFTSAREVVLSLQLFSAVLVLVIMTWISLKSLLRPELFRDVDRRLLSLGDEASAQDNDDLARVLAHMEAEKPYLDANLNLERLSHQLAMTARELSEILNGALGTHFFDFVNGYRIEYAKDLLASTPKQSVTKVLYESGFNSKSSFNTAFKKHTGLTPSAFRAQAAAAA